jgi:membrane protein
MPSLEERVSGRISQVRARRPAVDHVVRMQEHYGRVKAGQQAGAVTYFGFLSVFPILALAFFVVGYLARVYPDAQDSLVKAIDQVFPHIIGTGDGELSLDDVQKSADTVGVLGLVGVLYAGLGWLSAMRDALVTVFEVSRKEQPNFVIGKLRDLMTLVLVGVVLLVTVSVSGVVRGFSQDVLDWVGLGSELSWLLWLLTLAFGLAANAVLFYVMFKLLAEPHTPTRSLWSGALLGALGFEALKQVSGLLLTTTEGQPAFQAFGIALILLVWINYFSRVVLYAAAWAHTTRAARALRVPEPPARVQGPRVPSLTAVAGESGSTARPAWVAPFAAGGAAALALVAVLRKRER